MDELIELLKKAEEAMLDWEDALAEWDDADEPLVTYILDAADFIGSAQMSIDKALRVAMGEEVVDEDYDDQEDEDWEEED